MFLPRSRQLVAMGKEDFFAHEEPGGHHSLHQVVILQLHYWDQSLTTSFSGWLHGEIGLQAWCGTQRRSFIIFRFDNGSSRPSLISWLISVSCGDISVFTSQIFLFGDKFVIMTNMTLGTLSECLKFPELGSWEPRNRHSIWICSMFSSWWKSWKSMSLLSCQLCR